MDRVAIPAVCDVNSAVLDRAKTWIEETGKPTSKFYDRSRTDFERMCEREDLDCIICSTSWKRHVPVLLAAMRNGKNAVSEVPLIPDPGRGLRDRRDAREDRPAGNAGVQGDSFDADERGHQSVLGDFIHTESG